MTTVGTHEYVNEVIKLDKVGHSPSYGSVISRGDGRLLWVWAPGHRDDRPLQANFSEDGGQTWTDPAELKLVGGGSVVGSLETQLLRLPGGDLGLMVTRYMKEDNRSVNTFHVSGDDGDTWGPGLDINPPVTDVHTNHDNLIVLKTARMVMPAFSVIQPKWTSGNPKTIRRFGREFKGGSGGVLAYGYAYYSDDEGHSWARSTNETFVTLDNGGSFSIEEPAVVELKDGRVLMMGRTHLGRFFQAYSDDGCETWSEPFPSKLAASAAPCNLKRLPGSGDLLVVWNQTSPWELAIGLYRHRLSCAISKDEGETWEHHRNLESLDDTTYVEPPAIERVVIGPFSQPVDRKRYHHAPGPLRCNEPTIAFHDGKVVITYGLCVFGDQSVITDLYGVDFDELMVAMGLAPHDRGNKVRVMSEEWFYQS